MLREINRILTGKEKRQGSLIVVLDLIIALLDIGFLALLMIMVSRYTTSRPSSAFPAVAGWLSVMPVPLFLLLYLVKNAGAYAAGAYSHRFFASVSTRLSREQLRNYFQGPAGHFNHTDASVFVRRISQQPVEFSTYILANAQSVLSQSLLTIFTCVAILLYHPALFVIVFVLLLPPLGWIGWLLRHKLRDVRRGTKRAAEKALQFLHESLGGYMEANVYRKTEFFGRRYESEARQLNRNIARQQTLQALPPRALETVAVSGFFLPAFILQRAGASSATDWLTLGVFLGAIYKLMPAMVKILNSAGQMKTYAFILPDLQPVVSVFRKTDFSSGADLSGGPVDCVRVEQMRFRYGEGKKPLGADFTMRPGDLVALTGQSGSGKTTLLQLLAGFLRPDEGSVKIFYPQGVREPRPGEPAISYVQQQPFLLHDTLRKNISLTETVEKPEKMERLFDCCGLDDLLGGHPDGPDQMITENGRNISGGQRQRIMLARALYHDPALLLLDEPFSQLDEAAEAEMMQLLMKLAQTGMIILIATHSPAAAAVCHSVISLDEAVYA